VLVPVIDGGGEDIDAGAKGNPDGLCIELVASFVGLAEIGSETDRRERELGWTVDMIDGQPWWTPPRWIDPGQTPRPAWRPISILRT
jgi:hypothetical protein